MGSIKMNERIHTIDIIRGFALFGILIANMITFKTPVFTDVNSLIEGASLPAGELNAVLTLLTAFFVDGKFYPMFSMLFGLGFYIFYSRLIQQDQPAKALFRRRLIFLLLLGLIHLFFIWSGDILHTYALAGFFLPLFINRSVKVIKIWAIAMLGSGIAVLLVLILLSTLFMQFTVSEGVETMESLQSAELAASTLMATGSFSEIFQFRLTNEVIPVLLQVLLTLPTILPLFLIGLYFGKKEMFQNIGGNLRRWKKVMWIGLVVGVPAVGLSVAVTYNVFDWEPFLTAFIGEGLNMIGGPFLMLFYVASIVLMTRKQNIERLLMPFAAVGRMALSNYLMQSIIAVIIFNGYGFGLFGQVSKTQGVLIAMAIYAIQVVLSHFLLKRYPQGPMESLWRKWTYSKIQKQSKVA